MAVAVKIFLPFLNEFGNSKLFELYLIFHYLTKTATETEQFTSVTMVVPWFYLKMIWWIIFYSRLIKFTDANHSKVKLAEIRRFINN